MARQTTGEAAEAACVQIRAHHLGSVAVSRATTIEFYETIIELLTEDLDIMRDEEVMGASDGH